jgi:uncharacterized protein (TIGR02246 family)
MRRFKRPWPFALAVLVVAVSAGWYVQTPAQEQPAAGDKTITPEMAAVRKTADEFAAAFNRGDAKAVAAFWTAEGEMVDADGETIKGRAAIEKSYVDFFKENPKARIEVKIETVKLLGRATALEEGTLTLTTPGEKTPNTTRYSVLHVREEDGWRMASVREWAIDPSERVSLNDLEWLVGEWTAKGKNAEVQVTYTWGPDKLTLQGRYTVKRDGKVESTGTQFFGKDPSSGLRSWMFDSNGTFNESRWTFEEGRWLIQAEASLPDGSEVSAVNLLVPLGRDAFTWQSIDRVVAGTALPDAPPVRVTRVKAGQ